jgi:DNA segregation ATPase FtsK/SpoIIIE, S-DNA-T family
VVKEDFKSVTGEGAARYQQTREEALSLFKARLSRIDKALSGLVTEINRETNLKLDGQDERFREEKAGVADRNRPQSDASAEKLAWLKERISSLRSRTDQLREQVRSSAVKRNVLLPKAQQPSGQVDQSGQSAEGGQNVPSAEVSDEGWSPTNIEEDVESVSRDLSQARMRLVSVHGSLAGVFSSRTAVVTAYITMVCAAIGFAVMTLYFPSWPLISLAYIAAGLVMSLALVAYFSRQGAVVPVIEELLALWEFMEQRVKRLELLSNAAKEQLGPFRFLDKQIHEIMELEKSANQRREEVRGAANGTISKLRARHARILKRLERRRDGILQQLESGHSGGSAKLREDYEREVRGLEAEWKKCDQQAQEGRDRDIERLAGEWKQCWAEFGEFCTGAMRCREEDRAAQSGRADDELCLPNEFPQNVFVGKSCLDLTQLGIAPGGEDQRFSLPEESTAQLPVSLSFPNCGSMLVEAPGTGRERAIDTLLSASLCLLRSFPAGKIKLTLLDPVGLGESFAGLMQLSEYDETLVRGRIWTETAHIERKLSDLTERIEKVIQNYLRNRYATVADYNRDAGQLTEAYEFLVVADYPAGFSDLAQERLASLLTSGPRCGVYTLIHCAKGTELPGETDSPAYLRSTVSLRDRGDKLWLEHAGLSGAELSLEPLPEGEAMSTMLDGVGKCSAAVQQMELPFEAVAPAEKEIWSLSAAKGLRVPIGRSGADRIQYLELGRGTAQHALVAGRTGSGKSTLFHVIITATALWYSPREVEFYLVDFKHGVEFKLFAARKLPHARVIAIESDREFGLSVLQKVNEELTRRGNIFRKAGVQDLAGYRAAAPEEHLSRVMLLIDEFQEFFTDDDIIARDAALLLDRFVRQGRAFGIHVVLGSQTLSGMYTLAKSTLGQMGVRIALQCNEADSQLILSEENTAARLLSHSGEAIYNDMSGLLEGNSPFQVVWLPEDAQDAHLVQVAERSQRSPEEQAAGDVVVFEGSAPADIRDNPLLTKLLQAGDPPAGTAGRAWVGAASAIKGPTEVRFGQSGGSNLMIVGQNREAAFATVATLLISLVAGHSDEDARFIVFESEGQSAEYAGHLAALTEAMGPSRMTVPGPKEIERVLREVTEEHIGDAEDETGRSARRTYLVVFGLQRFRALRQDDSFSLSMDDEEATSPGELFANLLREGPEHGVHCIVWCDTLTNLTRALARSVLREFDMRVLFQMSGADSSELCDSTAGSQLGLYKALLAVQSDGSTEKFRPYSTPEAEYLEELKSVLDGRKGKPKTKSKSKPKGKK